MLNSLKWFNRQDLSDRAAIGLCVVGCLAWMFLLTVKYYEFGFYDWDFALSAHTMWNLAHGSLQVSLYGGNFLGNHAEYIAFLLTPLYWIFSHPLTLIYLKVLCFFSGCWLLYHLTRRYLGRGAIVLMLLYMIHPANIFMLLFEFHFENLAIPLIFLLFKFFDEDKLVPFFISALVLCLIKENMPAIVFMFGVWAFFAKSNKKWIWSLGAIGLSLIVFLGTMFVVTPFIRQSYAQPNGLYWYLYSDVASSSVGGGQSFLKYPLMIFEMFWNESNGKYIISLFGPLLFAVVSAPKVIGMGLPIFLQLLLSKAPTHHTIFYHYSATLLPFVFLASAQGLAKLRSAFGQRIYAYIFILIVVISCFALDSVSPELSTRVGWNEPTNAVRREMLQQVPPKAGVIGTFAFLPQLSNRKDLCSLWSVATNENYITKESPYVVPDNIEYALIDFGDNFLRGLFFSDVSNVSTYIRNFMEGGWAVQNAIEDIVFLKRGSESAVPLVKVSNGVFSDPSHSVSLNIDSQIELQSVSFLPPPSQGIKVIPIVFYWKPLKDNPDFYFMRFQIIKDSKSYYDKPRIIGWEIYPTPAWKKGQWIKDFYAYWPKEKLDPGEYSLVVSFFNITARKQGRIQFDQDGETIKTKSFVIGGFKIDALD